MLGLLVILVMPGSPAPGPAGAQVCQLERGSDFCDRKPRDQLSGEAVALGANALLGALTAGIAQHFQGGSFWKGLRRGAVGGSVVFLGKRVAVEDFAGAGMMGRGIAATGSSMIRNATVDRPYLSEIVLPLGPTRLYIRPRDESPIRVQLDVVATVSLAQAIADSDMKFELETSLSSGAPVFRQVHATERSPWSGRELGGVIQLSGDTWTSGRQDWSRVLAHERVHVIQYDQGFMLVGRPMEKAILPLLPGIGSLERWFDFGMETPMWALLNHVVDYDKRPWEAEAELLGRTSEGQASIEDGIPSMPVGEKRPAIDRW